MNILWLRTGWDSSNWRLMSGVCNVAGWKTRQVLMWVGSRGPYAVMIGLPQWNAKSVEGQKTVESSQLKSSIDIDNNDIDKDISERGHALINEDNQNRKMHIFFNI